MKTNLQGDKMAQPTWLAKLDLSLAQLSPSLSYIMSNHQD